MSYKDLMKLEGRYEAATFPLEITPEIYHDFLMGKRRAKKQAAIEFSEGHNIVITAGKTQLLYNLLGSGFYTQLTFLNCRVGTNSTTPAATDTDVGTVVGASHSVNWPRVTGTTGAWDTYFLSTENTSAIAIAEAMICTGSPGTPLTHFLITPSITHANTNNMTVSYTMTVT